MQCMFRIGLLADRHKMPNFSYLLKFSSSKCVSANDKKL